MRFSIKRGQIGAIAVLFHSSLEEFELNSIFRDTRFTTLVFAQI
jgi:hypothetical protein